MTNTIPQTYEVRLFSVRVFGKGLPFAGAGFVCKLPYGGSLLAVSALARSVATQQIARFSFGTANTRRLDRERPGWRKSLRRFDEEMADLSERYGISWAA